MDSVLSNSQGARSQSQIPSDQITSDVSSAKTADTSKNPITSPTGSSQTASRSSVLIDPVFWSILEHMGHEEHGGTWHMEAAQLDTQRKKGEAILKTSSTPTRPTGRVPQLDRPSFNSIELRSQQSNPKNVASPLTFL
ncbi:unnamed protein product [Microthlaspi erraticum]|uniref:Uncharacterized protein n=1 Tax=Microthlaspi erraticum TaxID=1685480 RepID=A0A6D2IT72_9BRAS|nr:unnamed protein product [Microthlaspi erraticum]